MLGTKSATVLFAVALLFAGQASTITGTMTGQIAMEGFLNIRIRAWLRRLITRSIAIIPAAVTIYFAADRGAFQLLVFTQAVLALQLPFAMIPLIRFTADRRRMGEFASGPWLLGLAWSAAAINISLTLYLMLPKIAEWLQSDGPYSGVFQIIGMPLLVGLAALLLYLLLEPLRRRRPGFPQQPLEPAAFMERVAGSEQQQVAERFEAFITHLHGFAFIKDPAGRYVYVSEGCSALLGREPEDVLSKTDEELWLPEFSRVCKEHDEAVLRDHKTFTGIEQIRQNGVLRAWLIYKFPIFERETQSVFLGGAGVDITDRKQAEEQLRGLAGRLQILREKERARTVNQVDDVEQMLAALSMHLTALARQLSEGADPTALAKGLEAASELLSSAIGSSVRITGGLRTGVLNDLGLATAIEWHASQFASRTGIPVVCESLEEARLDHDVSVAVFRIFEGILTNIERHARASEIRLNLLFADGTLVLLVQDNGRGITEDEMLDPRSLDLVEMRELALLFGGKLDIHGDPFSGTTVSLEIPVDARMPGELPG